MMPRLIRIICIGTLSVYLLTVAGCGNGGRTYVTGTVKGRVTLNDTPLKPGCVIIFNPADGDTTTGSALVKEDGNYEISRGAGQLGVPVGKYKVTLSPPAVDPSVKKETEQKNFAVLAEAMAAKKPTQASKILKEKMEYLQTDVVPQKYWTTGTSPLEVSVGKGENKADFKLTSDVNK